MEITKHSRVVKYGTVGVISLLVGMVSFNLLYYLTHRLLLANTLAYAISVLNGFLLNRQWTFQDRRGESFWVQCAKYFAANFVGYALHCLVLVLSLATYASFAVPSRYSLAQIAVGVVYHSGKTPFHPLLLNACALTATAVVTVWNYVVNRNWSFKH